MPARYPAVADRLEQNASMGTGLGMTIVSQLVTMMGGQISFTSKVNEGTSFVVTLRFHIVADVELKMTESLGLQCAKNKTSNPVLSYLCLGAQVLSAAGILASYICPKVHNHNVFHEIKGNYESTRYSPLIFLYRICI